MAKNGPYHNPDLPCSRCHQRPRYIASTGRVYAYCIECKREMRKEEKRRVLKRLRQGEFIPCIRCGERARHHTENTVYDYCYECYRKQQNGAAIRRAYRKHFADHHSTERIKKPVSQPPAFEETHK